LPIGASRLALETFEAREKSAIFSSPPLLDKSSKQVAKRRMANPDDVGIRHPAFCMIGLRFDLCEL
jgi:hypothetical protein